MTRSRRMAVALKHVTVAERLGEFQVMIGGRVATVLATLLDFLRPFLLGALWFLALAAFLAITNYLWQRIFPGHVYTVSVSNEKGENITSRFLARQREVIRPTRLDQLYEIYAPNLEGGFVEDVQLLPTGTKLEFKGVDVGAVVKLFDQVLQKTPARIEGKLTESSGTFQITINDDDGKVVRPWTIRVPPADQNYELKIDRLFDRGVYRALYYVHYESRKPTMSTATSHNQTFPSAEALEAYYAGRWHLDTYQLLNSPEELDRAETHFATLRQIMPRFHDGLLLLGVTLSEQRREEEAIAIFEQIEAELAAATDKLQRRQHLQAKLFSATAHRKRYRPGDNHVAVSKLSELEDALPRLITSEPNDSERRDLMRLEISVLSELVSAVGHYQVHIRADTFIDVLRTPTTPAWVKFTPDEESDVASAEGNREDRLKLFLKVRERLLKVHNEKAKKAKAAIQALGKEIESDPAWQGERARYLALLISAQGYTQYRFAQPLMDHDAFKRHSKQAIAELREAESYQPHNYSILQNLSLVLLDKRVDNEGRYLEEAKRLLERSIALKPRDFYGPQLLAQAILKRTELWGAEAMPADDIKKVVAYAEKARALRPTSVAMVPLLVEAYSIQWEVSSAERAMIETKVQTILGSAKRLEVPRLLLQSARIRWLVGQLRHSATDADFQKNRDALVKALGELDAALKGVPLTWQNHDIAQRHDALRRALQNAKFETRKEIAWVV